MQRFAAILATSTLVGCTAPSSPTTVDRAKSHIVFWDGQTVVIDGWLGECSGLNCAIYPSRAEMEVAETSEPGSEEWVKAYETALGIGSEGKFDRSAEPLQFMPVRLTGRLDSTCTFRACFDRAPDIHPIKIEARQISPKVN